MIMNSKDSSVVCLTIEDRSNYQDTITDLSLKCLSFRKVSAFSRSSDFINFDLFLSNFI